MMKKQWIVTLLVSLFLLACPATFVVRIVFKKPG
jgi:hypothetical protein